MFNKRSNSNAEPGEVVAQKINAGGVAIARHNCANIPHLFGQQPGFSSRRCASIEDFLARSRVEKIACHRGAWILNVEIAARNGFWGYAR